MPAMPSPTKEATWKERYSAPSIFDSAVAREAPERGLIVSNRSGKAQLYAWDVPKGALRQLTDRPEGLFFGTLSPDGRWVYHVDDQRGNEIGHVVRLPFTGGAVEDVTPAMAPYAPSSVSLSQAGNALGLVIADAAGYHCFLLGLAGNGAIGEARLLWESRHPADAFILSYDGDCAVVASTERSHRPQFSLLALDTDNGTVLGELWDGPGSSIQPSGGFAPLAGDRRLLATTNRSGAERPVIWDTRTGERIDLDLAGLDGDVAPRGWSHDGRRLLLCQTAQAVQQLYTYDLQTGALQRLRHPAGTFGATYYMADGEIFAQWQDATHPNRLIALDGQTGAQTRVVLAAGSVPSGHPWRSITFPSTDGQMIQGWLGVPAGAGPFPTILETHGGPTSVTMEVFSPGSQAWLDHGYAFLTINYRGSTTFGRDFERQIWGDLGHWEVEDMVAACGWLVAQGIAQPDKVFLTGYSYGGYLTLQALGTKPDLWAGGMAGVAIADWTVQHADTSPVLRGYQEAFLGGTPQENPAQYAASSPITYAEQVRVPVLIIQGRNDTRTPARPIEIYEARLKGLGKPIEVHWFDAGHLGSRADVALSIAHQELMLRFADRLR